MKQLLLLACALLVMMASPAYAAITYVQSASCAGDNVSACTTPSITTTTGTLLVANSGFYKPGSETLTVSDSKTNTWTNAIAAVLAGQVAGQTDYAASGTRGSSHTFTCTTTNVDCTITVVEISGADASPLDQTKTSTNTTPTDLTRTTGNTSTTTVANEILLGFGTTVTSGVTFTNDGGAGWTQVYNVTSTPTVTGFIVGRKAVSSTGAYAYTYTTDFDVNTMQGISTWKEAAAAGTRQRCVGCGSDRKVIE